jgi:hypothetical protein
MVRRASSWVLAALAISTLPGVQEVEAQSWRTLTSSRQASGESDVRVKVEYAAGTFSVKPGDRDLLYQMTLTYDEEHFEPVSSYRDGTLNLGIDGTRKNIDLDGDNESRLDLLLSRGIPMSLDLEFGAVKADFDLSGIPLLSLDVSTGASESRLVVDEPNPVAMDEADFEVGAASFVARGLGNLNAESISVDAGVGNVELDLTGEWKRDGRVSVDMGLGALTLRLPTDVGIRIRRDTFLTGFKAPGMEKQGDDYYSANWESADLQLTISVDAAFGSIEVEWAN